MIRLDFRWFLNNKFSIVLVETWKRIVVWQNMNQNNQF